MENGVEDLMPTIYYRVPTLTNDTALTAGTDPLSVNITSDTAFSQNISVQDLSFDPGTTGLSIDSLTLSEDAKTLTITFTGTAQAGTMTLTALSSAFGVLVGTANGGAVNVAANPITVSVPAPEPTPDPEPDPAPTPEPDPVPDFPYYPPISQPTTPKKPETADPNAPSVVEIESNIQSQTPPAVGISGVGESDMQHIVKPGSFASWIDRVELPQYARDLYRVLSLGIGGSTSSGGLLNILTGDKYFTLPKPIPGSGGEEAEVESVLTLTYDLDKPYASGSGDGLFQEDSFSGGLDLSGAGAGDRAINYPALKTGDVVRTSSYNGIYATKLRKSGNSNYDQELKEACAYINTAFQAFDRDHPEVFWLSGSSKLRMSTVTLRSGSETYKETYLFFTLADDKGFSARDPHYTGQEQIEADILRRDQAVEAIAAAITGETQNEKLAQLNRWLTEHNEYNTSPDLSALANPAHECLSALTGSVGTAGPVCDGYSRAFKVVCDHLEIPCVLVDGYAKARESDSGGFHMWNSVEMSDGQWYGVDVTWNDPVAEKNVGAVSGYENDEFLLVGADTEVYGLKFSASHPPVNRAADGGVAFTNGPVLSMAAFNPLAGFQLLPFRDVAADSWYLDAVQYVYDRQLMSGTAPAIFAPQAKMTRAMVWTVLGRLDGADVSGSGPDWYAKARDWAVSAGISDGTTPSGSITRQELAAMLWRAAGSPVAGAALEGFADHDRTASWAQDAVQWAVAQGVLTGDSGRLRPTADASRAEVAAMLARYCEHMKK